MSNRMFYSSANSSVDILMPFFFSFLSENKVWHLMLTDVFFSSFFFSEIRFYVGCKLSPSLKYQTVFSAKKKKKKKKRRRKYFKMSPSEIFNRHIIIRKDRVICLYCYL